MSFLHSPAAPFPAGDGGDRSTPQFRSLDMVCQKRTGKRVTAMIAGLLAIVAAVLVFVPWQQTVIAPGQVSVFSPMDRPTEVEALIPGRLVEWRIREGQTVKAGDVLAILRDIDSKFLDTNQAQRLEAQRTALQEQKSRAQDRATRFEAQIRALSRSQQNALNTARQRVAQAKQRRIAAAQSLISAEKSAKIAIEVAQKSAGERVLQAQDRVVQAEQALLSSEQDLRTAVRNRSRINELLQAGLRSRRDDELAQNDLVKNETGVERARLALQQAKADARIGGLARSQADLEIDRVQTEVARARAAVEVAESDITAAQFDLNKVLADTTAQMSGVSASVETAREGIAKVEGDLQKLAIDRQNLNQRTEQQVVRAPRSGRVVRVSALGPGGTVKAGDVIAVLAPDTQDRVVELTVTDNDVALLSPGRPVRLQFAGWPALQFSGFPSVAVGTFAGRVSVIDAVDDGTARYRVIVQPDAKAVTNGKDQPWPEANLLRPGAEVTGWIQLDTVPLGFELWRQFNAFPATVKRAPVGQKEEGGKPGGEKEKEEKEKKSGLIKVKYPK